MLRRTILSSFLVLASCSRCDAPAVDPAVAPAEDAPAEEVASPPSATSTSAACDANEYVTRAQDLAWLESVTERMREGIARKRLACFFGTPLRTVGAVVELKPRSADFARVVIGVTPLDVPSANVNVAFADPARPPLASVEKVLGPSKAGGTPGSRTLVRRIDLPAPEGVTLTASLTMAGEPAKDRVESIMLMVVDRRAQQDPPRCLDGARVTVLPAGPRFAPGRWSFVARDATSHALLAEAACTVPEDALDLVRCSPDGEKGPGAIESGMPVRVVIVLPVTETAVDLEIARDGTAVGTRRITPHVESGPATCAPSGTWIRAHEQIRLGATGPTPPR